MRIVLLGPPGAGKGTQCKRIVERYKTAHLSSGDILRQERAEGSELGEKARSYMDSGALVPDAIIIEMMVKAIAKCGEKGFLLDGFPRTVVQAEELDRALERIGAGIDLVLNLQVPDEMVARRLTGRRSCPKCGAVYHIETMPPKTDEICDNDGAELVQRPDDRTEVVQNRLKTYHDQTAPLIDYYGRKGLVHDVDGSRSADEVSNLIFERLDALCCC